MLRESPTEKMRALWTRTFETYRSRLKPNRKTGQELVDYLQAKYHCVPFQDEEAAQVVIGNVMENEHYRRKLGKGQTPDPVTFSWQQGERPVWIGIDLASGMYHVKDDERLWEELCAFQGLEEEDLDNRFCVYTYIACLQKQGTLETVLRSLA